MLKNFLFDIAGLTGSFTLEGREQECINNIKQTVGNKKVLVWMTIYIYLMYTFITCYFVCPFFIFNSASR